MPRNHPGAPDCRMGSDLFQGYTMQNTAPVSTTLPIGSTIRRTEVLGLTADAVDGLESVVRVIEDRLALRARLLVTFVNPGSRAIAVRHPQYLRDLATFDIVLPDGSGMSMAMRTMHRVRAARISFDSTSLAPEVLRLAETGGHSVVFVGGLPGSAERASKILQDQFPRLRVLAALHGYASREELARKIAMLDPDIVVCGMGVLAQESLLLSLAALGWNGCGFTCGGYLDQLSEGFVYYPPWINKLNLRWAFRLAKEPRRLWRRYLLDYPSFVMAVAFRTGQGLLRFPHVGSTAMTGVHATASVAMQAVADDKQTGAAE